MERRTILISWQYAFFSDNKNDLVGDYRDNGERFISMIKFSTTTVVGYTSFLSCFVWNHDKHQRADESKICFSN